MEEGETSPAAGHEQSAIAKEKDQEAKMQTLLEHVKLHCTPSSEHEDLCTIGEALKNGDELQGKILSEGFTNYCYQLYLKANPDVRLFAKVCFSRALWNPDPNPSCQYTLERQKSEYDLMLQFSKTGHAAVPYLLLKVDDDSQILVTQWATADQQWADQFVTGHIDARILTKVATFLAQINLTPCDPEINREAKTSYLEITNNLKMIVRDKIFDLKDPSDPPKDAAQAYAYQMGESVFLEMFESFRRSERERRDILLHGDAHAFNILVEPPVDPDGSFGPKGDVVFCDWEMAHAGMLGKDMGSLWAWPLTCAYALAAKGDLSKARSIVAAMDQVWDIYVDYVTETGGKDSTFVLESWRGTIAWCGVFMFLSFYAFDLFIDRLDFDGVSDAKVAEWKGTFGRAGLEFFEYGFQQDDSSSAKGASLEEVWRWFHDLVDRDLTSLQSDSSSWIKKRESC